MSEPYLDDHPDAPRRDDPEPEELEPEDDMPNFDESTMRAIASWLAGDAPDPGSVGEDDEKKAADWLEMEGHAAEFVLVYGRAALLRCISEAVK